MIPQRLSLVNFMCYRQAVVDFSGIHVACLSGDNGAGKSTLLDAMTWALWGKARARRDDELIRLGQKEMEVDFTFRLGPDLYRVVRKRRAGKRGVTVLELQVQDGNCWRSLAESGLRATEEKIQRLLRLDYDTFVNSAFLRQGRANEFTVKTPAERKRVLGDILGLEVWQVYEDRARQRLQEVLEEAGVLDLRLEEIEAELARRPEYEAQFQAAQAEVVEASAVLQEAQQAWQEMEAARADLRHLTVRLQELADRIAQAEREREALRQDQEAVAGRLDQYRSLLAQAEEIEAGFAAYQAALAQERALGEKLATLTELNEERRALEDQIRQAGHELEIQRERLAQRIAELQARLPTPEWLHRHEEVRGQVAHLTQLRVGQEAARADLSRLGQEQAALQAANQALKEEMEALQGRITLLEQAEALCPLCGQSLAETDRQRLVKELELQGRQKADLFRSNRARLDDISAEIKGLESQIRQSAALLEELPRLEREAATLAERVRVGLEAAALLEGERARLVSLEAALAAETYAPQAREGLAQVLARAVQLGYDAAAHEAARRAAAEGEVFAGRKRDLDEARRRLEQEQAALVRLAEAQQRWQEQETADRARYGELEAAAWALQERLRDAPRIEAGLEEARAAEAAARQRLGAAQQRLSACDALAQQRERHRKRREELARLRSLYEELRTACSVQGVPAMIIEAVVPEIEAEANRILGRLSGGLLHVRLDTQRETLAGNVQETLEIKISDELGTRDYAMYSGGESFRVDFALRLALSRLLARRAGAQLQTLVIDEGFGTQDAQGRERLVEAIHSIQDEFACILVITHVEELRDAFPVRIEVTKTPQGSVVAVV